MSVLGSIPVGVTGAFVMSRLLLVDISSVDVNILFFVDFCSFGSSFDPFWCFVYVTEIKITIKANSFPRAIITFHTSPFSYNIGISPKINQQLLEESR